MKNKTGYFQPAFNEQSSGSTFSKDLRYLSFFAVAMILLHLPVLSRYGIHRDELYAYSCSLRLGLGYLDHALVTPWVTAFSLFLFGKSIIAFRIFPLLSGAAVLILTGLMARALGGRRFSLNIAALCIILSPYFVRTSHCMSQISFEALFWTASALVLVRILKQGPSPWWLVFGITSGLGLITRPSMLVYGVGVTAALMLTPYRRHLGSKWFWLGGVAAFLILLPNLVWQMDHDWATLSFLRETRNGPGIPPLTEFLFGQALYLGPLRALVCAGGFIYLMTGRQPYLRVFGWIFLVTLLIMSVMKSKIYYILPVYPVLIAAGGVFLENVLMPGRSRRLVSTVLLISGVILLPLALPVLPLEKVDAYTHAVSFGLIDDTEKYTGFYHDQVGWDRHAAALKTVYETLPAEVQNRCFFLAGSYGAAGALEYFLDFPGRPPVACNNLSWHYWPQPDDRYDIALVLSYTGGWLEDLFDRVVFLGSTPTVPLAADKSFAVWLCLEPKGPYREIRPDKVTYDWM